MTLLTTTVGAGICQPDKAIRPADASPMKKIKKIAIRVILSPTPTVRPSAHYLTTLYILIRYVWPDYVGNWANILPYCRFELHEHKNYVIKSPNKDRHCRDDWPIPLDDNRAYKLRTMEQKVQKSHDMEVSLTQDYSGLPITRPIALVGLMGCGKSMVGRNLAAMFQIPFTDSDTAIERAAGITVADIFDLAGEAKFREMEFREIETLLDGTPAVIATGGGAFCQADTAALLRDNALVVWLKAKPDTLLSRIGNIDSRPLLHKKHSQKDGHETPIEILTRLNDERTPFYQQAHLHVNTDGLSKQQAASKVIKAVSEHLASTNIPKDA